MSEVMPPVLLTESKQRMKITLHRFRTFSSEKIFCFVKNLFEDNAIVSRNFLQGQDRSNVILLCGVPKHRFFGPPGIERREIIEKSFANLSRGLTYQ